MHLNLQKSPTPSITPMDIITLHSILHLCRVYILALAILSGISFHSILKAQGNWEIELRGGSILYENKPTTKLFNRNPGDHELVRRGRSTGVVISSMSNKQFIGLDYGMMVGYTSLSHRYRLELNPPGFGITEYISDVSTNQHFLKIGFLANRKFLIRTNKHWNFRTRIAGAMLVFESERTSTKMKTHLDKDYIHYDHIVRQSLTRMPRPRRTIRAGMSIDATLGYTFKFGDNGINIFMGPEVFLLLDQTLVIANAGLAILF